MAAQRVYDWDDWLGRGRVTLAAGKDYACGTESIIQQARSAASKRGLGLRVLRGKGSVTILSFKRPSLDDLLSRSVRPQPSGKKGKVG